MKWDDHHCLQDLPIPEEPYALVFADSGKKGCIGQLIQMEDAGPFQEGWAKHTIHRLEHIVENIQSAADMETLQEELEEVALARKSEVMWTAPMNLRGLRRLQGPGSLKFTFPRMAYLMRETTPTFFQLLEQ